MPSAKENSKTEAPKERQERNQNGTRRLYRSERDKIIAGVAGGLGKYFNIDSTLIRIFFILMAVFGGSGLIIYIVLWLVIPTESSPSDPSSDYIKSNIEDMRSTTKSFAHNIGSRRNNENSKFWWAIMIIVIGFLFLLNNYGILSPIDLHQLWPVILIFFGLVILLRK